MAGSFLERLRDGPPIVDRRWDGHRSSPRPRRGCAARRRRTSGRRTRSSPSTSASSTPGAELIETNTFGANRRKLSARYLEDEFARINEAGVKLARDARQVSGKRGLHRRLDRPARRARGDAGRRTTGALFAEQAELLAGRGVDLFATRDLLRPRGAPDRDRGGALGLEPADRGDDDLRRGRGDDRRRPGDGRGRAARAGSEWRRSGRTTAPARTRRSRRSRRWAAPVPLAAMPNIGLASMSGGRIIFPHATPDYFAEFAAHARDLGARLIGGCCGTTPTEIAAIARALAEERAARAPLGVVERELAVPVEKRARGDASRRRPAGGALGDVDPDRPAARRELRRPARDRRGRPRLRARRVRGRQRQRDRPRRDEPADRLRRDRAHGRDRDDPAPDPARHDDHGPRGGAAWSACRGDPQRARGHGRPARGRRLPRLGRRLRDRLDRAHAPDRAPQPRRELQREGDRRPDLVLPRRRRQPDGGRPRPRSSSASSGRSRRVRASR